MTSQVYNIMIPGGDLGSEKVSIQVEVPRSEVEAFTNLWRDYLARRVSIFAPELLTEGAGYEELKRRVSANPATSHELKRRIEIDDSRDPVDALSDIEMAHAVALVRFSEAHRAPEEEGVATELPAAFQVRRDRAHAAKERGLPALRRLLKVAQGDSGQCRKIAGFLLGLYNGERFPFDLTDLRGIDDELFEDCMLVLKMDARFCEKEVHRYFENGAKIWEQLAEDWGVEDVFALRSIAKNVIERGIERLWEFGEDGSGQGMSGLVAALKHATKYREET